ncbi:MAG: hypothetical protein QOI20_3414 [Acidimicrobiaceae bacterium]|jgi:hypothetical protein|nr:hypothetical protein [Acidimicrobiaceae bacterium]
MARINRPLARLALDHTLLFSLNGGLIIVAWATFLFRSFIVGLLCGAGTLIGGLLLYMPKYGPLRKYLERHIDE